MMYAGALSYVISDWGLSTSQAGSIQTAFNVAYALSVVVTASVSGRWGVSRVLLVCNALTALTALLCALFARSYWTAIVLFPLHGLVQGGTYSPALILLARLVPPARRGAANGWMLGISSMGYLVSIALASSMALRFGVRAAFLACAAGPLFGALILAARWKAEPPEPRTALPGAGAFRGALGDRKSLLVTLGYAAHSWELLGMWAWMPAFLTAVLQNTTGGTGALKGIWIAAAIHACGGLASLTVGTASDRFGRKPVLVAFAAIAAAGSFVMGWLVAQPAGIVFVFAAFYSFAAVGDSPALSAAMMEAVDARQLGNVLAIRSILGFGAGGFAPLAMGAALDFFREAGSPNPWAWGFAVLGAGGLLAVACALLLPSSGGEGPDRIPHAG